MSTPTDNNILPSIFADLLPEAAARPLTLKQSLEWANRNCQQEVVKRLVSRAVVARLVEEVETLQALLRDINKEFAKGFYVSYPVSFRIDDYFSKLDKS
jgi:hypothetical protein